MTQMSVSTERRKTFSQIPSLGTEPVDVILDLKEKRGEKISVTHKFYIQNKFLFCTC